LLRDWQTRKKMQFEEQKILELLHQGKPRQRPGMIGIAASTGGPPAIQSILQGLPLDWTVPIVIAQHMPPNFTTLFAERLNRSNTLAVCEAKHGDIITNGHVYIAPGGKHAMVRQQGNRLQLEIVEEPREICQPSGDILFESIAEVAGTGTIGAVLTGMGADGAKGLAILKRSGGITIAESERTAVVFGMPNEAIRTGMVDYVLPLQHVPTAFKIFCC
jgi:two-component system, chemotaxis family, protein-glutamate methylesterase/glutaminase